MSYMAVSAQLASLSDGFRALDAAIAVIRLNLLDEIWTTGLEGEVQDVKGMAQIGSEMVAVIGYLQDHAPWLGEQIAEHEDEVSSATWRLLESSRVPFTLSDELHGLLNQMTWASLAEVALVDFFDAAGEAIEEIRSKVGLIESGRHTPGDLKPSLKCVSFIVGIGALATAAVLATGGTAGPFFGAAGSVLVSASAFTDVCRGRQLSIDDELADIDRALEIGEVGPDRAEEMRAEAIGKFRRRWRKEH